MKEALDAGQIVIAAGFQGVDESFNITTLGRGGSDTTAAALAAALDAEACEIYTDVEGVFTTDPRVVADASKVDQVSYDEMLELASLGAGVMHSRSIEFAKKYRVNLRVKPSYMDGPGTLISYDAADPPRRVTGVAFVRNEARISLMGVPDQPGVMSQVFAMLSSNKIPVDMVVQNVGVAGTANVSFTVAEDDLAKALEVATAATDSLGGNVTHQTDLSKVSVVGHGMQTHTGVAAQMFQVLAKQNVNIHIVTTSEIKLSVLIDRKLCDKAVNMVHEAFGLDQAVPVTPPVGTTASSSAVVVRDAAKLEEDIVSRLSGMEDIVISDVYADSSQARVTIASLNDSPGVAASIFSAVAEAGILVDMIIQNAAHDGKANITFTVPSVDEGRTVDVVRHVLSGQSGTEVSSDPSIGKLSVVGIGLRSHTDVGARMFRALAEQSINVEMVNTSEIKVSVVVAGKEADRALAALKDAFDVA